MADRNQEGEVIVTRRELYEQFKHADVNSKQAVLDYILNRYNLEGCSETMVQNIKSEINTFSIVFTRNWRKCHRNHHLFEKKYCKWLNTPIHIKESTISKSRANDEASTSMGRPKKTFRSSSQKSKTRKIKPLLMERTLSELTHATKVKLRTSGQRTAASMVSQLVASPGRATKVKKAIKKSSALLPSYTPEEALCLMDSTRLSIRRYNFIRKTALRKGSHLFPSYEQIKLAKKMCYPEDKFCRITESLMEIQLQSLVDLTLHRLCSVQTQNIQKCFEINESIDDITMIYKWGCDGSGSHSRYKQKAEADDFDDSHLLVTSMVPLQLYGYSSGDKVILWQNPKPCSTAFCRPIILRHAKENQDVITKEFENVRDQIRLIKNTQMKIGEYDFEIHHKFEETMIDGKVCNILAHNTSSQKCYICQATSKDMNKLDIIRERECNPDTFSWGLSTLHAKIRFMECILHIGYKLDVKKWQCRNPEDKTSVEERKKNIIASFRKQTGLLLDTPKQGGGNTNDGNSARRFFKNAKLAADITGVDEELIYRFQIILSSLSCGHEIDVPLFKKYCNDTAELYVSLYQWYPMPVTLHKILIHSAEVIETFLLPIGQMSEEAQEARHKDIRRIRLDSSRKTSRIASNTDILHSLLISSDPVIASLFEFQQKTSSPLHPDVSKLLKETDMPLMPEDSDGEYEDSENSDSSEID